MDLLLIVLLGLAMGLVFGIALEKSRVFEPGMILGQMRLQNFTMVKVFVSAIVTGLIVLACLHGLGLVTLHPKALSVGAQVLGGGLIGVGMVIAGACPGTVFAQIGAGYKDAWMILLGGLVGAFAYGYALPLFAPYVGGAEKMTYADITGLPFWLLALGLAALLFVGLILLEKWRPSASETGAEYDGRGCGPQS